MSNVMVADERSEEASALDTTKDKWYKAPGAASSSRCPREGSMLLERRKGGGVTIVRTNCNSWRCLGCRNRNDRRFRAIVEIGCSTLGRSCFITITYKAGSERLKDAECVAKDWRALWRRLSKVAPWTADLEWLRVMEKTKRQTPHFHLIAGPINVERQINCWGSSLEIRRYRERLPFCECVAHTFARAWSSVQRGESYIVHAIEVNSSKGAGKYLSKYMIKTASEGPESRVSKRRWSTSRGWPVERRVRLEGSLEENGWRRRQWADGYVKDFSELEKHLSANASERRMTEKQAREAQKRAVKAFIKLGKENQR